MNDLTLVYPTTDDGKSMLLGEQKSGTWEGYYNGFGGKLERGETRLDCAIRELKEELNIEVVDHNDLVKIADIWFYHDKPSRDIHLFVYTIDIRKCGGHPKGIESELHWFQVCEGMCPKVPYASMPPLDRIWLEDAFLHKYVGIEITLTTFRDRITDVLHTVKFVELGDWRLDRYGGSVD